MTTNTHGGANRNQGRRTLEGKPPGNRRAKARTITLMDDQWEFLLSLVEGNYSAAVRLLIEERRAKG